MWYLPDSNCKKESSMMVMAPSLTDLPYRLSERFFLVLRAFGALEEAVCSSHSSSTFSAMSPSLELRETRSVSTYDGFLRPNPPSTKNAAEISRTPKNFYIKVARR